MYPVQEVLLPFRAIPVKLVGALLARLANGRWATLPANKRRLMFLLRAAWIVFLHRFAATTASAAGAALGRHDALSANDTYEQRWPK